MDTEAMDIDSFFKKKDKKNKKSKKKTGIINPATMLQEIAQADSKQKLNQKRQQNDVVGSDSTSTAVNKEDDEWEEAEEPIIMDITSLRINSLPVPMADGSDQTQADTESDLETQQKAASASGGENPWSKQVPAPVEVPQPSTGPKKYIPPSQRQAGDSQRTRGKTPCITDCAEFPTLGEEVKRPVEDTDGAWKTVKQPERRVEPSQAPPPANKYVPPHLRNRYALLH